MENRIVNIPNIIKELSRKLRKNMTYSEEIIWNELRFNKVWYRFLRQKPIYVFTEYYWLDRFIISDFYCHKLKLIIEIDWSVHNLKEVYELDKYKEELLINLWYKILRFKNEDVINDLSNVMKVIHHWISSFEKGGRLHK